MRRITVLFTALLLALGMMAGPAMAWHQHEIVHTHPVTGEVRVLHVFRCEPVHIAEDPHPRHFGLHAAVVPGIGPERGNPGPITVRAVPNPDPDVAVMPCPTE